MIDYGINTTQSQFWIHFHPTELKAYWYKTWKMKRHVAAMVTTRGRSPDGSITGLGYLVAKAEPWIWCCEVPSSQMPSIDWMALTAREMKKIYEPIVIELLMNGGIRLQDVWPSPIRIDIANSKDEQFAGIDCWYALEWSRIPIELKAERVRSVNLFVQKAERSHKVHLTPDGQYRPTDF